MHIFLNKILKLSYFIVGIGIIIGFYLNLKDKINFGLEISNFKLLLILLFYCVILICSIYKKFLSLQFFLLLNFSFLGDSFIRAAFIFACIPSIFQVKYIKEKLLSNYFIFYYCFIISNLGALIVTARYDLDIKLISDSLLIGGVKNFLINSKNLIGFIFWPALNFLEYFFILLIPVLWSRIYEKDYLIQSLIKTIKWSFPLVLIILINQKYFINSLLYVNYNDLWKILGRYPANFIDPNSFGVLCSIYIALLLFETKKTNIKFNLILSFGYFMLGLFSGSRTFFLILGLTIIYLFKLYQNKLNFNKKSFSAIIVFLGLIPFIFYKYLPIGLTRLIETLTPDKFLENIESRLIYTRIGIQAIKDNFFTGLGLGRFFFVQNEIAEKIGIDLGVWRDNANNYYLQSATEGGGGALFLLILGMYFLLRKIGTFSLIQNKKILIIIFFISLLTGPHLNSADIRILFIILLTLYLSELKEFDHHVNPKYFYFIFFITISFIISQVLFIPKQFQFISRGLHNIEKDEEGFFRWTGSAGRIYFCETDINHLITIKNLNPSDKIFFHELKNNNDNLLSPGDQHQINVGSEESYLDFQVTKPWLPSTVLGSNDNRILGVAIKWPNSRSCF